MPAAFGFENGILPIAALMALAVLLPMPFARMIGLSQGRLAAIMLASAGDLLLISAVLLWTLTRVEDATATSGLLDALARAPRLALGWGPVWALVWLLRAQGIERRRGLLMGRGQGEPQ